MKLNSKPFSRCKLFTPNIIFIKHAELKEMDEKLLLKRSAFRYCPEKYKIKRNTKNISPHVLKMSSVSLVLRTRENADIFTHSMKNIWYSPQKSKYPLCIGEVGKIVKNEIIASTSFLSCLGGEMIKVSGLDTYMG